MYLLFTFVTGLAWLILARVAISQDTTTPSVSETTTAPTPCLCTEYTQISRAVASCTDIILSNIYAPASSAIVLTALQTGTVVTFAGATTFGFTNSSQFRPIQISGNNVTIRGEGGAFIDGGGQRYWDGLGSNGGLPKLVPPTPKRKEACYIARKAFHLNYFAKIMSDH